MTRQMAYTTAFSVSVLLSLGSSGGTAPRPAQSLAEIGERLRQEGWQEINANVYEKRTGDQVEHVAVGPEAGRWARQALQAHHDRIVQRAGNKATVTQSLAKLRRSIAAVERSTREDGMVAACTIDWFLFAHAAPAPPDGAVGIGHVRFANDCGISAGGYASGYATTPREAEYRDGHGAGTHFDIARGGVARGGPWCYSEGFASLWWPGFYRDKLAKNDRCE